MIHCLNLILIRTSAKNQLKARAQIFKLLRIPGNDSMQSVPCKKSIPLWNYSLETSFHVKEFKILELSSSYVYVGEPLLSNTFPTANKVAAVAGDKK
jgi:hypothetical protein